MVSCAGTTPRGAAPLPVSSTAPIELMHAAKEARPAVAPRVWQREESCELARSLGASADERRLIGELSVLARIADTEEDVACAVELVRERFPQLAEREPPPRGVAEFRQWWEDFGGALRVAFGPDVLTVLPEGRRPLEGNVRAQLAPLLCPVGDAACGDEAREFLRDVERRLEAPQRLRELEDRMEQAGEVPPPGDEVELARCASSALEQAPGEGFDAWRECVVARMPQELRAPRDAFRLPERGYLKLTRFGYWDPCMQDTVISLSAGLAVTRVACTATAQAHGVERWSLRRARPGASRRAALFVLLSAQFTKSPAYAQSYPIPAGLVRPDDEGLKLAAISSRYVSDAPTLRYALEGVLAVTHRESRYVYDEVEPLERLEVELLLPLLEGGLPSCAAAADLAEVERLVAKVESPEAEPGRAATLRCSETVTL